MASTRRAEWSGAVRVDRDGSAFEAVCGDLVAGGAPISAATRFQAGSISKSVLAVVTLHLVEAGVVDLGTPIGSTPADLPDHLADRTLHELLTHTAGMGHWRDLPDVDVADPPTGADLLARVLGMRPPHPVGTWSYSGFGFLLAAEVLERASGRPYADLVREAVFVPAGMTSSTSGTFPVGEPDRATGHTDGVPLLISPTPTSIPGTGDLWTTVGDLTRFSRALHGGRLLRREHVAAMTSVQIAFPSKTVVADERIVAEGYGYGTWVGTVRGEPATIHPGDNVGYRSLLLHSLPHAEDVAVLTNDDGPSLRLPLDLALAGR